MAKGTHLERNGIYLPTYLCIHPSVFFSFFLKRRTVAWKPRLRQFFSNRKRKPQFSGSSLLRFWRAQRHDGIERMAAKSGNVSSITRLTDKIPRATQKRPLRKHNKRIPILRDVMENSNKSKVSDVFHLPLFSPKVSQQSFNHITHPRNINFIWEQMNLPVPPHRRRCSLT